MPLLLQSVTPETLSETATEAITVLDFVQDPNILSNLVLSLVGLALLITLRIVAMRVINRQIDDPRLSYAWRKWIGYISYGLFGFAMVVLWLPDMKGLSTFLGLFAAGLAVVLKDPLVNLVSWLFIVQFFLDSFDVKEALN